jgi:hypothetical protein
VCRTEGGQGEQGVGGHTLLLDQHGEQVASKTATKNPVSKSTHLKVIELDSEK